MTNPEVIRHALLATLYGTRAIRVGTSFLLTALRRECGAQPDDALAEIGFLKDAGFVDTQADSLGSSDYWKLTAAGVLHYERNR